ncbi:glutaminase domain-containing protein [Kutzneria kofuensis]|uniref:Ricin-type beta-trefoil lectin protein n=1 Tax=Kutzneria kofuensis TaxID=103725 RepID=A0A7W9NMI7_9PSEU|nr:DUF5127 domain-containing protein [Kutzneria kofuensis]MBB5897576.1 hypothetical protein [Kutzneria kofuensis]
MSRRSVLRLAGMMAAAGALPMMTAPGAADAAPAGTFTPLRPPATPLAVRSPYLSAWHAADNLPGAWSSFWNGRTTAICGIVRVDGTSYVFAGAPSQPAMPQLTQTSLQVTATRSIYTLTGGGVTLTVTFFSPVDPENVQRQCVPLSYVTVGVASADGNPHRVSVYLDISAEWAHGDNNQLVTWREQQTGSTTALTFTPASPSPLAENNDQASWGTVVLAGVNRSGLTWQIGQDTVVRGNAAATGALPGTIDTDMPRQISNRWPVLGLNADLGSVGSSTAEFTAVLGHIRTPVVSYLTNSLSPWWTHYWSTWQSMMDWFVADRSAALSRAVALDAQLNQDATAAAGPKYAAICALAVRQAMGATELVDRNGSPWAMLKEISSNGNMCTVDVIYPAFPGYLYLGPAYLRLLLEPLFDYAEHGGWPKVFAEHDLGTHYPNATGHNDGEEEDMPVEESANMLIMSAALTQHLPAADARSFAQAHYAILKQWADYLVDNTLDPGYQNQTDDFTGFIAHSANLALKGIVGVGAMSLIARFLGNAVEADHYLSVARSYISQWFDLAQDPSGTHLKMAYDQNNTWSLKYNGYPDELLGLDLVPEAVHAQEASWYQANAGAYGVLLDPRNDYTKADWEIWTAAWLADRPARDTLINGVFNFANSTSGRVPVSDWYRVANGTVVTFAARPVVGGFLALLPQRQTGVTQWVRIQNKHSGKLLAVQDQSTANSAEVTQYSDNGTPDHLWAIVPDGPGVVRIVNRHSGKVLAVHVQSTDDGAHVQQYVDNGTPDHLWRIVDAGDGWSKIVNVHSGKVLAVQDQSTADSAQVTQWSDNGTEDHLWRLL